jgi:hypothetical protein
MVIKTSHDYARAQSPLGGAPQFKLAKINHWHEPAAIIEGSGDGRRFVSRLLELGQR